MAKSETVRQEDKVGDQPIDLASIGGESEKSSATNALRRRILR